VGGGDHLGSDGDGDAEPVAGARDEASPVIKVEVPIDAEGPGGGMSAGEFAEGEGDGPADEGGEDEAQDDGGPGEFDGGGGAEEKSGADGTADGDHRHLSSCELAAEAGFWVRGWSGHEGSYSYIRSGGEVAGKRWMGATRPSCARLGQPGAAVPIQSWTDEAPVPT
jgi:hypothetical protein